MAGRRTAGSAIVRKARKDKYTAQFAKTEANRKRKQAKHLKKSRPKLG